MIEYIPVLCLYLTYLLVPLAIYGLLETFFRTKLGHRFEAWLFNKLGIDFDKK